MPKALPVYEAMETDRRPTRQEDIDSYGGASRGSNAVCWLPQYGDGDPVLQNDMVRRLGGLFIANKNTSAIPSIRFLGNPIFIFDDTISWTNQTQPGYVATGTQFTANRNIDVVSVRAYINDISGLTEYHFAVTDDQDHLIVYQKIQTPAQTGWHEISIPRTLFKAGETVRVYLEAENYGSPQTPWSYQWLSTLTPIPAVGSFYHDMDSGLVQISKTDNGATDRSADLAALVVGSTVDIEENASRFVEYRINNNPIDMGTYYEYQDCELLLFGSNIRNNRVCDIEGTPPPGGNSEWVENLDYWSTNVSTDFSGRGVFVASPGAVPVIDFHAYGVDIKYIPLVTHADWDLIL